MTLIWADSATDAPSILLADDELIILEPTSLFLHEHGFRVITATDGAEAVECYREAWTRIKLVILDVTMPRMTGLTAFRMMKEINPLVRAIFWSGSRRESEKKEALDAGALCFLDKPVRLEELLKHVEYALAQ